MHETVFRRQGAVHAHIEMEIKPVLLLSGNRKSIAPSKAARPAPGESADGATAATPMDGMVIPYADVFIHAGDFTMKGSEGEVQSYMYICIYTYMYTCMYVCMYIRIYVCMYIYYELTMKGLLGLYYEGQ